MNQKMIEARTLKGFRDFLPESMIPREALIETARRVYRSYGFAPIDTPALEYAEILLGKGSDETDRQMYRFTDAGGRDVAMRFDLTVPLARFVAQHIQGLGTPFKRYHIATVWRGESPQAGRFREFMQCDFDIIGSTSIVSDIETALVIYDLISAIGFQRFTIGLNNRKLLNGVLQKMELRDFSVPVLRAIDKLAKIGLDGVRQELSRTTPAGESQIQTLLDFLGTAGATPAERLAQAAEIVAGNELGESGVGELRQVIEGVAAAGVRLECFQVDVSIARGLDYYTGMIYETILDELPSIGSVCSGGRYDNLTQLFTRQPLPGIGASLGLDRLLAAMEQLGRRSAVQTPAEVMIVYFDTRRLNDYLRIAAQIRRAGMGVELYPEPKKLRQQLAYADRKGFAAVVVAGENEFAKGIVQIKSLRDGQQFEVATEDSDAVVRQLKSIAEAALAARPHEPAIRSAKP